MRTLQTDADIAEDGSMKLLSPLPAWLKPGRQHVLLVVSDDLTASVREKRVLPKASPAMMARRRAALADLREMGGLSHVIPIPWLWQRDLR